MESVNYNINPFLTSDSLYSERFNNIYTILFISIWYIYINYQTRLSKLKEKIINIEKQNYLFQQQIKKLTDDPNKSKYYLRNVSW